MAFSWILQTNARGVTLTTGSRLFVCLCLASVVTLTGCWIFDSCEQKIAKGRIKCDETPENDCCVDRRSGGAGVPTPVYQWAITHVCTTKPYTEPNNLTVDVTGESSVSCDDAEADYLRKSFPDPCSKNGATTWIDHRTLRTETRQLVGRCNQ